MTSKAELAEQNFNRFMISLFQEVEKGADSLQVRVGQKFDQEYNRGVFDNVFPGFSLMEGCGQGETKHLEGDVLAHTREVLLAVAGRIAEGAEPLLDSSESRKLLVVAALIHDIEKPNTRVELSPGDVAFPGHEEKAGNRVPEFGKGIGLPQSQIERLEWLVAHHGDFYALDRMNLDQLKEFYSHPDFDLALIFYECDCRAFWESRDGSKRRTPVTEKILNDRAHLLK